MGNCAPDPHYVRSIINQNHPWWKALAELIDNSFDAGASSITIEYGGRTVSISDNGAGVPDVSALLTLGKHVDHKKTSLGIFGIGAKDAWLSCADIMEVITVHGGKRTSGTFDINSIIANSWEYDDPTVIETTEKPYTVLWFRLREGKEPPGKLAFDELAWLFTPAISSGRSISVCKGMKTTVLAPVPLPLFAESIKDNLAVDGKRVSFEIGLVKQGSQVVRGPIWLMFGHRVIDKTNIGCGSYSTLGIAGTITLHSEWRPLLKKNKDGLAAGYAKLDDAILERIEPILQKAQSLCESLETSRLRHEIEKMLNASTVLVKGTARPTGAKGKQKRPGKNVAPPGTVAVVGSPRKIKNAAVIEADSIGDVNGPAAESGRKRTGWLLDWCEIDKNEIGQFIQTTNTVQLNLNHPFVRTMKTDNNKVAMYAAAVAIITDHGIRNPYGKPVFSFAYESFAKAFGEMLIDIVPQESQA